MSSVFVLRFSITRVKYTTAMKNWHHKVLTKHLKQYEVAVWAVYLLGGTAKSIDTEDAAVKCHELAPDLFSWQKHKGQINLELVRVSLSDAKKAKNGRLLSGSGREGWRLSSRGLDWIRSREESGLSFAANTVRPSKGRAGSIDSVRRERERQRLLSTDAWLEWQQSKTVSPRTAQQVFRIDEYTTARMAAIKVARLRAMFEPNDELSGFLETASRLIVKEGEANER